jgi:hypothetical protein
MFNLLLAICHKIYWTKTFSQIQFCFGAVYLMLYMKVKYNFISFSP